jgi:hypothetical protein
MKVSFHIHQKQNFSSLKNSIHKSKIANSMLIYLNNIMLKLMMNTKRLYKRLKQHYNQSRLTNRNSMNALLMQSQWMK